LGGFRELFGDKKILIGMVHLGPLPGSARDSGDLPYVIDRAVEDAIAIKDGGMDAVMIENFFDAPFHKSIVPPATVAAMTAAAVAVKSKVDLPIGINVLRNDVVSAISIAHACGADFVRCNVFVGAVVADQGMIEAAAREAQQIRRQLGARVQIWADIGVKHSRPLAPVSPSLEAQDAVERGLADALIVSGEATGAPTDLQVVHRVKSVSRDVPVLIGSGTTAESVGEALREADGAIVGTFIKTDGLAAMPVAVERVKLLVRAISR
jgi:membrane complex biogenesis BtpA family protein